MPAVLPERRVTLAPMMWNRCLNASASALVACFLAACATQAAPPTTVADASALSAAPTAQLTRNPGAGLLVPSVPQPAERPVAPPEVTDPLIAQPQRIEAFIAYTAKTYRVDPQHVRRVLAQAEYKQKIIDAISRPAEGVKPWRDYRPIFLNDARIAGGVAFYTQHRDALERIAQDTGVPGEYIVAIIGVETNYGKITGSYRVLDALYTLAFSYPKRAPFFAGELAQLFALTQQEPQLDPVMLKGSYAGAMGMGQFMPSSYRLWAKDGDSDGRRDLLTHTPDVFASIANYFVIHGWQRGAPVVARATRAASAADFVPGNLEPVYPLADLASRGYRPQAGEPLSDGATLLSLDGEMGKEYWLGYRNFYVITRYNRSPMYSLSVHQLAQAIRAGASSP